MPSRRCPEAATVFPLNPPIRSAEPQLGAWTVGRFAPTSGSALRFRKRMARKGIAPGVPEPGSKEREETTAASGCPPPAASSGHGCTPQAVPRRTPARLDRDRHRALAATVVLVLVLLGFSGCKLHAQAPADGAGRGVSDTASKIEKGEPGLAKAPHWSFQPIHNPAEPTVHNTGWPRN